MKPKVGILLDAEIWRKIRKRDTCYERIRFYNRAAEKLGLTPFYMTVHHLSLPKRLAKGYIWSKGRFSLKTRPIPSVIHNRTIPTSRKEAQLVNKLATKSYIFNQQNRYSKYKIHRLLKRNPYVRTYLPVTYPYTSGHLKRMLDRYPQLYIKPQSGSVGQGILKLSKINPNHYKLQLPDRKLDNKSKKTVIQKIGSVVGRRGYIIQQGILLATYKGNPYDIRVSVQRNGSGEWQITGMVGKAARKGKHVTNVAQGGKVYPCSLLFRGSGFDPAQMKQRVGQLALAIAGHLGKQLPHLADIGLDIGVDRQGKPYFIEMNGRDQRYSFGKGNMSETWYKTYETPLKYAKYALIKKERIK